jgi:cell division protein FtsI/penicillin-binding protein 2/cell division protein FtsW (lipid II flippase)
MAVTWSWEKAAVALAPAEALKPAIPVARKVELRLLLSVSLLVAIGLGLVLRARTEDFGSVQRRVENKTLVNVNRARDISALTLHMDAASAEAVLQRPRPLRNVGALRSVLRNSLTKLKPFLIVRTPKEYLRTAAAWISVYFGAFYLVHAVWRWRRFSGDGCILPALHLLTGIGLAVALSLRDPLRDTLEFQKFCFGVALGCLLLLLPVLRIFDYRRYAGLIYTPLIAAFVLFGLLAIYGSGPTGNDSKVNLGPVQPVEIIKVLLVFFFAGYFARRWEWLRELRERRVPRWLSIPRLAHAMPVLCGAGAALILFFSLKDSGPALVIAAVFLAMYAIARGRAGLALAGVLLVVGGVAFGYRIGWPATVAGRIEMWLSPWNNDVRGGDQLVHSMWAFATGGPLGSGPGRGDPAMIPAGHTDLVLPAFSEEWGVAGVITIAGAMAFLLWRSLRTALAAPDEFGFFLALGLAVLIAVEMLLISAGVLGIIPLTGVASPFLSSGNSAMLMNFFVFATVLAISARTVNQPATAPFRVPVRIVSILLAASCTGLVARAVSVQAIHDDELLGRDVFVYQADGVKRSQHNPRLNSLAQSLRRGTIYDRNGVVLAESVDGVRRYPFGRVTAHLLGDARTAENFAASNSSLIEDDQKSILRGYSSYAELAPLVRYRHQPGHAGIAALQARNRDVRSTIDVRLQQRVVESLERGLRAAGRQSGAAVVMDVPTGDVLAMASSPAPSFNGASRPEELLDRARYGQYPPGSTFKLVTAIAALRKDPELARARYRCSGLGHGRVGARIAGWNRPVRDDAGDPAHGSPDMARALAVSCNAYFAQLGVLGTGAEVMYDTARALELPAGDAKEWKNVVPFAAIGQGPVLVTPFKLARVSATIASGGMLPQGRWLLGEANTRTEPPRRFISEEQARFLAAAMRAVVTSGTGRSAMSGLDVQVAGKTGTAQVEGAAPHSWFTGFAPFDALPDRRIAFAVVVEHGGYGARAAAPVARDIVAAARDLGIIARGER